MNLAVWIYAFILFLGSMAMVSIGILALIRHRSPVVIFFALLVFSSSIYAFGYSMEITRLIPEAISTWSRVEYVGIPYISSFLFLFILHFITSGRRIPRIFILLPLIISFLFMAIRQTNHLHWQYYTNIDYVEMNEFMVMTFGKGVWYWIFAGYNVLGILASALIIAVYLSRAPRTYRNQAGLLLLGTAFPAIPYVVYISGLFPSGIDIVPAALTVSTFLYYIAVFRYNLFALIPVGRDRLVETMSDAVVVLNKQFRIADANPSALKAFSPDETDPIGQDVRDSMPLLDPKLESGSRIKTDGSVWEITRTTLAGSRGSPEGILMVAHDITELERLAKEDVMTGLLNRHSWNAAVETELVRLTRHGRFGSVIYVDLDHFKNVNDTHGHAAGDRVLTVVGRVLKEGVRRPDLVGRYGGEEFVLFLPESHPEGAAEVAERLRIDLTKAVKVEGLVKVAVTGSFGVAGCLITDETQLENLVNGADKALYQSKQDGRNRVSQHPC